MREFRYTVTKEEGIHVLPAGKISGTAEKFKSKIWISKNEKTMNCKSVISVIALSVRCGETVTLKFEGEDEDVAFDTLLELFEKNY